MDALDNYYPLIGRVVVRFQDLDFLLNTILMGTVKEQPDIVAAFATSLSFAKKIDVLKSIIPYKSSNPTLLKRLDAAVAALSEAEEQRNRIVHSMWGAVTDGTVIIHKPQVSRKKGLKNAGMRKAYLEDLEGALIIIQDAMTHLFSLAKGLHVHGVSLTKLHKD